MFFCAAQSRGADSSIKTEDYDPYLNPGPKTPLDVRSLDSSVLPSCLLALYKGFLQVDCQLLLVLQFQLSQ